MIEKLKDLIHNKQFWLSVIGVIVLAIKLVFPDLPIEDTVLEKVFILIVSLIFGISFTDAANEMRAQSRLLMEERTKKTK